MQIKNTKIAAVILAFMTASTSAQNWWNQLPGCSQVCATLAAQQAGCSLIDIQCICRSSTFLSNLIYCINASGCPQVEVAVAEIVLLDLCDSGSGGH